MSDEKDYWYKKYNDTVNMTAREFKSWAKNKCSYKASVDRSPVKRNLRLISKNKSEWTKRDVDDAKKVVSFIRRMRKVDAGKLVKGCRLSKRTISLKNWRYNPNK